MPSYDFQARRGYRETEGDDLLDTAVELLDDAEAEMPVTTIAWIQAVALVDIAQSLRRMQK
jgi:hypothetical protein